ncbi:hypothetical protein GQ600_10993 [Phytophthora cactorum]|nr:hypothetical protein GQ600_10993 [Phytophthora cactorum]
MHYCPMDSQSSSFAVSPALQPRVLSHKRRRNGAFTAASSPVKLEEECDVGESSSDESDSSYEVEEDIEEEEEEEALVAAKRRRRADLDGLKKSVRHMERKW